MGHLRQHESESLTCVECRVRPQVGPCAACHGMVCGDCCSLVTDPAGKRVICISCARLIADVHRKPLRRRSPGSKSITWAILAVLFLGLFAWIFQT